jgi:Cupin domain
MSLDVPAAAKVAAAHSHDGYEETIYGLEGVLTWTIEGTPTDVGPGDALFIPRGAVHQFDNTQEIGAKGARDRYPRHPRTRLLPRGRGNPRRRSRRAARLRSDRSRDAPPRPHPCTLTAHSHGSQRALRLRFAPSCRTLNGLRKFGGRGRTKS